MTKNAWIRFLCFYGIALSGSYVFRILKPGFLSSKSWPFALDLFLVCLEGLGPLLGFLFVMFFFRFRSRYSLLGKSPNHSLMMLAIPLFLFSGFGAQNDRGIDPHFFGFVVAFISLVYVLFEELGWRAYLLQELQLDRLKAWPRALIIGILWYVWHLNFPASIQELPEHIQFAAILVFASWGFEKIIESNYSLIGIACFHFLGSLMSYNALIQNGLSVQNRWIIFGVCLIGFVFLSNAQKMKSFPKKT